MAVPRRHVLRQVPVIRALVSTAIASARRDRPRSAEVPGPHLTQVVPPRPDDLVRDYLRAVGGDPGAYRGVVPAHLFPQWGFPLLAKALRAIPYDLKKALNGGCRIEIHRPLPAGEPLHLEAWLEHIDDNGSRAVIKNRLTTGTPSAPGAVDAWMYAVVPLANSIRGGLRPPVPPNSVVPGSLPGKPEGGRKKERPHVPADAREIGRWKLEPRHAVDFAVLTGDVNPVHWLAPYARAAGFKATILHGFATLARAIEGLNKARFAGDPARLKTIDVKFVRPIVLPARVGLYVTDHRLFVGTAPGGPAFLTGTWETTDG